MKTEECIKILKSIPSTQDFYSPIMVEKALQHAIKAEKELEDIKETYNDIMAEKCSPHCTCVPALRKEIAFFKECLEASTKDTKYFENEVKQLEQRLAETEKDRNAFQTQAGARKRETFFLRQRLVNLPNENEIVGILNTERYKCDKDRTAKGSKTENEYLAETIYKRIMKGTNE